MKYKRADFDYALDKFNASISLFEEQWRRMLERGGQRGMAEEHTTNLFNIIEFKNDEVLSEDDFVYYSDLARRGDFTGNPLSVIPLFNSTEMLLSTQEELKQKEKGLFLLHLAF